MAKSLDGFQPQPQLARTPAPNLQPKLPASEAQRLAKLRAGRVGRVNPGPGAATAAASMNTQIAPRQQHHEFSTPRLAKPSFRERFEMPLFIGVCVLSGFFIQSLWFGLFAIAMYALCTLLFRINSRITFSLAFISLVTVVAMLLIRRNVALASNFATYTFLLLVIGVIALSFEARPQQRKKRRNGR